MSIKPPKAECRRLSEADSRLMYGAVVMPDDSWSFIVCALMEQSTVGNATDINKRNGLYFTPFDCPGFQFLWNKKGDVADYRDFKGMVPTLIDFVDSPSSVMTGSYVDFLKYHTIPKQEAELRRREITRAKGRKVDEQIRESAEDMGRFARHIAKKYDLTGTAWKTKEDHKAERQAKGVNYLKHLEKDYTNTNEYRESLNGNFRIR
jgi:hypothetical protein